MKKIVLDVDGVLLSFMPAYDEAAKIVLGKNITVHKDEYLQDHYHLGKRVDCSLENVDKILTYMQESGMYEKLKALDGAKEAVQKIREAGFHITVVTALPEQAKNMRLKNLKDALNFVPDEIICVGMGKSKADALKTVNPDVFIDDRIEYLISAPHVHHLVWCDQKESQEKREEFIDVHVNSLEEWTKNHMPLIVTKLDKHYAKVQPLQYEIKLESFSRKNSPK